MQWRVNGCCTRINLVNQLWNIYNRWGGHFCHIALVHRRRRLGSLSTNYQLHSFIPWQIHSDNESDIWVIRKPFILIADCCAFLLEKEQQQIIFASVWCCAWLRSILISPRNWSHFSPTLSKDGFNGYRCLLGSMQMRVNQNLLCKHC